MTGLDVERERQSRRTRLHLALFGVAGAAVFLLAVWIVPTVAS